MENDNQDSVYDTSTSNESEKTLTQSEVNAIVAREKQRAAQAARREVEQRYQQEMESLQSQQMQQQPQGQAPSGINADALYQQIQEKFNQDMQKRQIESEMNRIADSYHAGMQRGSQLYEDFGAVTQDFDPSAFPQLTFLVASMENAPDIIYDLSKNPSKLAQLDYLASRNPQLAQKELQKLSRSITDNRQALQEAEAGRTNEPLDRLQPSRIAGSNGQMGVSDLRNQPWLRG